MSKQPNIRWTKNTLKELERLQNNFNAKMYRTKKKNPNLTGELLVRQNKTNAIANIKTRADFNKYIKELQDFSKRGSEKTVKGSRGTHVTQWEYDVFKEREKQAEKIRIAEQKKFENKPVKIAGKKQDATRAQMGSIKENEMKPRDRKPENMTTKEYQKSIQRIDNILNDPKYFEKRQEVMRENYLKGLQDSNILDSAPHLKEMIEEIPLDKFFETVQLDETATFFHYKDETQDHDVRVNTIVDAWETAYNEWKNNE